MLANGLEVIGVVFEVLAYLMFAAAAIFTVIGVAKDGKYDGIRFWFQQRWVEIEKSRITRIPNLFVEHSIKAITSLIERGATDYDWFRKLSNTTEPIALAIGAYLVLGIYWAIGLGIVSGITHYTLWVLHGSGLPLRPAMLGSKSGESLYKLILTLGTIVFPAITTLIWIKLILELPIVYSAIASILLLPAISHGLVLPSIVILLIFKRSKIRYQDYGLLSDAIVLSFSFTLLAFVLGRASNQAAWIPQTLQMFTINAVFDMATIVVTYRLLKWSILEKDKKFTIRFLGAAILDVITAAILAVFSLYFGLIFSQYAISIQNTLFVLIGRSLDGSTYDLGPLFWVMHTSFIPTLIYLSVIIVGILAKILVKPLVSFYGVASNHSNPMKYTATLFGAIGGIFMLLSVTMNHFG